MLKSSLNPAWPHFFGIFVVFLAVFIGVARVVIHGSDWEHCDDLLNEGTWLDSRFKNWQPEGCMMYPYKGEEVQKCIGQKELTFIGDSVTRKLFFQTANLIDNALPTSPPDSTQKHADYSYQTKNGLRVTFLWDPFLNGTKTKDMLTRTKDYISSPGEQQQAMVVLGSGLWYLRYANTSGGIPAWESNMDRIVGYLSKYAPAAQNVVILPVEDVVSSKLAQDRAETMHGSDIDAMNSDLFHRIAPLTAKTSPIFRSKPASQLVSLPTVFNKMLHESLTDDGLHFSDGLVRTQAQVLVNLHCNDIMPKVFPYSKTCCNRYPWPSFPHLIFLAFAFTLGPYIAYRTFSSSSSGIGGVISSLTGSSALPSLIISFSLFLIYIADRTGFWLKEHKQFDPWNFGGLCLFFLVAGIATMKRADSDLGFLNRDQTDEWKGWMQIVILIYHYFNASKVSGIYNPVRVLVASYLFMTGYGHTAFYLRKADFGFLRVAQVLVRLNLYTILLAYVMNTDYISYYFTPLVSMWYLILYATFAAGARFNDRLAFVLVKIGISAAGVAWFMKQPWLLQGLFDILSRFCGIHWSAKEWAFRVNLDVYMVYIGMLASIAVIKVRELRLTDHTLWPLALKLSTVVSVLVMVWFFVFELYQESKFTYNTWHPYISFLPVLAFVVLRNCTAMMRSMHSRLFAFAGKCSLELFIIQYHLYLAADSKGVLLVIPGVRWRAANFLVTASMFVFICDRVAFACGEITNFICAKPAAPPQHLPLPVTQNETHADEEDEEEEDDDDEGQGVAISMDPLRPSKDEEPLLREPDTPIRPRRWVDRLSEGSQPTPTQSRWALWLRERNIDFGLKTAIFGSLGLLWLFNLVWVYP